MFKMTSSVRKTDRVSANQRKHQQPSNADLQHKTMMHI